MKKISVITTLLLLPILSGCNLHTKTETINTTTTNLNELKTKFQEAVAEENTKIEEITLKHDHSDTYEIKGFTPNQELFLTIPAKQMNQSKLIKEPDKPDHDDYSLNFDAIKITPNTAIKKAQKIAHLDYLPTEWSLETKKKTTYYEISFEKTFGDKTIFIDATTGKELHLDD